MIPEIYVLRNFRDGRKRITIFFPGDRIGFRPATWIRVTWFRFICYLPFTNCKWYEQAPNGTLTYISWKHSSNV